MGFFSKIKSGLKQGLAKTVSILNTDVRDLFKTEGRLVDDAFCDELFEVLVKTDMGVPAAQEAADQVKKDFRGRVVERDAIIEAVKGKLKTLMAQDNAPLRFAESGPTVWLVCGVNGCGKTTSIAKLGKLFRRRERKSCWEPPTRSAPPRSTSSKSGPTVWGSTWSSVPPEAIRRASPIRRPPEPSKPAPICVSSTPPAACRRTGI